MIKAMGADEPASSLPRLFRCAEHKLERSAPLVPQGDATLLFVNAGMVPFKEIYRPSNNRCAAASSQVCSSRWEVQRPRERRRDGAAPHPLRCSVFRFGDYFKSEAAPGRGRFSRLSWGS